MRLNVRYIAIMDNIDIARGVSDIVPMQDLFNEWHAKNTSDKVRRVMQSRGNAGIPLTTNPPFGYRKDKTRRGAWGGSKGAEGVGRGMGSSLSFWPVCCPVWRRDRVAALGVASHKPFFTLFSVLCGFSADQGWCFSTGIVFWISFSISRSHARSSGVQKLIASPGFPARPVRPMRCT